LRNEVPVNGLAHITGGGLLNLLRIGSGVGYEISAPLPILPVFDLIAARGDVAPAEMWEVFNMGCGFCVMVAAERADEVVALLRAHHPGTAVIGQVTSDAGVVSLPGLGLIGDSSALRPV
jgi:phosphoribosylformylglycinamidine cyclo-ligase